MAVILMMLMLGGAVLIACVLMPREIGKEDEPLSSIRLELPRMESIGLRMNPPRRQPKARPAIVPPPPPPAPEGPSAMGAPQPVLTQEPMGVVAIPGQ